MKTYIAGPMRNYRDFNKWAFYRAEDMLDSFGQESYNPARVDEQNGIDLRSPDGNLAKLANFDIRSTMAQNCDVICNECDRMYMLKGWENSAGARAEHALAIMLGLEIQYE